MDGIYLDAAATSMPKSEVVDSMMPYLTKIWHNPSSLYSDAIKVKQDVENARKTIANFIGANTEEIYFTSGGSESNCMAIRGWADKSKLNDYHPVIITTQIEHKSIMSCVKYIAEDFCDVIKLSVDSDGFVNINILKNFLEYYNNPEHYNVLVSIQFANNEVGVIQHVKEISKIVHSYGAVLHVDAVQAFGQIQIDVNDLNIDMMSVSGHKIGTPKGIGFLYKRNGIDINPLIFGTQEQGLRGGTENVPYIIGMAKAVELAIDSIKNASNIIITRDYFINRLEKIGCKLIGSKESRLPNNISVMLPEEVGGEECLYMLDMSRIMISVGSACNSHSKEPSHVLKAIGLNDEEASRVIRITFHQDIAIKEIDKTIKEIEKIIGLLTANEWSL